MLFTANGLVVQPLSKGVYIIFCCIPLDSFKNGNSADLYTNLNVMIYVYDINVELFEYNTIKTNKIWSFFFLFYITGNLIKYKLN